MGSQKSKTRRIPPPAELFPHENWGTQIFLPDDVLLMHIGTNRHPLLIHPKQKISIGRWVEEMKHTPDIDFLPYDGIQHGVSRLHAVFTVRCSRVTLTDLGSRNGTWLNGTKLEPNQPRVVRTGDDMQFAGLLAYIYFIRDENRYAHENNPDFSRLRMT